MKGITRLLHLLPKLHNKHLFTALLWGFVLIMCSELYAGKYGEAVITLVQIALAFMLVHASKRK